MWSAYLFQTTTGNIGPRLNFEDVKWSISLNEIETCTVNLRKSDLPNVNLDYWLAPWWAGVVYLWNDTPIFAGPIVSAPAESFHYVYIECRGIRQVLAKRLVVREQENWDNLAKNVVQWKGLSLGTIAKKVVQLSLDKPGGSLPISFPYADQTAADDADHQRTYKGFNIQNLSCDDVLTKLSEVSNGPDIMFRPRLKSDSQLTFDMLYGSERDPRIPQNNIPVWDTTAARSEVTDLDIVKTGVYQTSRVFSSGAGTDAGTIVRVVTNEKPLGQGFPLLETTISYSDSENRTVVLRHAEANLAANKEALLEIQMTVRANEQNSVDTFSVGEEGQLKVKDLLALKDGSHKVRILNMNGSTENNVRLSVQTED